jgi:hypothetical protein
VVYAGHCQCTTRTRFAATGRCRGHSSAAFSWASVSRDATLFATDLNACSAAAAVGHVIEQRTTASSLPSGWSYVGCLIDGGGARILLSASETVNSNTPQGCIAFCTSSGYAMAGVEYGESSSRFPLALMSLSVCSFPMLVR